MTTQPSAEPRNGFGITALALAIVGLLASIIPFVGGFAAIILGGLAILFALLGWGRVRRGVATNKKMVIFSLVLGAAALAFGIWIVSELFTAVEELDRDLRDLDHQYQHQMEDYLPETTHPEHHDHPEVDG